VVVFVDIMLLYKLSVAIDRIEENIVDVEIIYTKLQNELRELNVFVDRLKLPFE
jgi:hypothetical protein